MTRERLYIASRVCFRCTRVYLYPGYGSHKGVCNDCLMTYGRGRK
jgi:hypothetical protein